MNRRPVCLRLAAFDITLPLCTRAAWALLAMLICLIAWPLAGSAQTTPPYGLRVLSSNFQELEGVAVDSHGNVYATDGATQLVQEFLAVNGVVPSNPTVRNLGSGYNSPRAVAVDQAGDVFVANYGSIVELMAVNGSVPDNPTIVTVYSLTDTSQIVNPRFDGLGNLDFMIDGDSGRALLQIAAVNGSIPANPQPTVLFTTTGSDLGAIAPDSKGNLFFQYFDLSDTSIYEFVAVNGVIPANSVPLKILLEGDPPYYEDFAVDASGNLFIAEVVSHETCSLVKVSAVNGVIPANPTVTTLYSAPQATFRASAVVLDSKDNMYIADFFDTGPENDTVNWELAEVSPTVATTGVTLTPSTFDYGSVDVSSSANETFTLANTGTAAVNITSTSLASQVFTVASTTCTASLAAGGSCTYKIEFAPIVGGAQAATFSVTDDAGTQTASLTGTGVVPTPPPAAQAALTPATADFGSVTVGSSSSAKTFTLANAGTATLPITSVAITGANAAAFALGTNGCGSTLAAGASCTVSIAFSPTAAGSDMASLTVIDSVGTQTSVLTGTGVAAVVPDFAIAASPSSQTIAVGGTANYTISITPSGGFDSAVALAASGLPPGGTVTFTPASVTPGTGAASSAMAIHVASLTTVSANTVTANPAWKLGAPALATIFLLLPFRRLRKWRSMLCTLVFSVTLFAMGGCGGGFGLSTPPTATTYTVTVTGTSGSLTHSTTVQITVQPAAQAAGE